jgi:hypothetical protein
LITRETVFRLTPASAATSRIVGRPRLGKADPAASSPWVSWFDDNVFLQFGE